MAALDELNQLERVFLRLGHAETDDQLQDVISKFLPPVLLKLSSGQEGVRKKVMELLVHLNKRIKSRPRIQLPVETLLVQYQDPAAASFVTNFTIIYIKMGFPRLSESQQSELAPTLITAMESKPQPQQDSLLQLLIPALCHMSSSSEARTLGPRVLAERPVMLQLLLDFMLDVLLMPYGFVLKEGVARPAPASPQGPGSAAPAPALPQPPPGMSVYGVKRVMGEVPWSPEQLEQCKLGIVKFLEAERVCDVDSVLHLVVASSDTRHSVATAADLELKSKQSIIDWNNPLIISKMFKIYLGDIPLKAKGSAVKPELKHEPVSTRVKLKILPHFLRSRLAAESFPSNIQVVYDGLFGTNTNAKLKYLTLQFVHHICTMCPESNKPLGLMLLNGLTKLINEHREDVKLLCSAYSAVGKLSSRMPQLFTKDIALVQQFFESMCQAEAEVRLAIQEALCMMVAAYEHLQGALLNLMEALVAAYITKPEVQVRQVAVKFCSTVFAADHVNSRYLLLLAAGDPREEVSGEAQRVLRSPTTPQPGREGARVMPPFPEMMEYIQEKASERLQMSDRHTVGTHTLPFSPATFTQVVLYLRACLACSAGATPTSQSLSDMQDDAPMIGQYVRSLLCSEATPSREAVHAYMELLQQLLSALGGVQVMYCLLEIVSVCPEQLAHTLLHKSDWIKVLMSSSKEDLRELAAQLFAVVFSTLSGKQLQCVIHSLLKSSRDAHSPETQHGSILALGFMMGRYMSARRSVLLDDSTCREEEELIAMTTSSLGELLESECPPLALAAVTALGEMGRSGGLPVPAEGCGFTKLRLVDALLAKISSGKETGKMKERAVQTLGLLPVGDGAFPHQQKILQGLMDSVEAKQVELQFTVGEALTNAAVGTCSRAARDPWTTAEDQYCPPEGNGDQVSWMLNSILSKYIQSANPHVRQASCIWLLTITNTLQRHPDIQSQLKNIQSAFISILSDPDEVSQGVASKALGLVYELCGPQEQQQLVSALVETLMTGKRVKHAVSADTEVFQEETLGRAPDGHGLSTYKELCALASDLNQPDLVYKFMNLANHHAMWNSRKGAAFGFNVIAAKAGEQLEPFLPQLVPRLYRYQFDPNPSVREAMSSIWDALVTEKSAVEKYYRQILNDVITNLTSNIWRVRESSCLALRDLLRTRQEEELLERMQEIWETLFRVLDDIKESVRKAADSALKTLSNVCVRLCESAGVAAQKTVAVLLPTLLDRGVVSSVAEVRSLSVQTLVKISKTAGARLKPHASRLVPALLEALSVLEPQVLNYLSLRASEHEKDVMDAARLSAVKSSPLMETINMCVLHLDGSVLADLVPKLCDLLKSNVGLGTKGGCCSVIVSLTVQLPQEHAPHSGRLMAALMIGVSERSSVLQKSLAATVGHVVRTAKSSSVEKLLQKLNGWYLEKDEAGCRAWCCVVLHAVSEFSPDVLRGHCGVALPLAFLGLHQKAEPEEPEGGEATQWAEIWNEHTPGSGGGIRLYLPELVSITQKALQSPSWRIKAQGAAAMATIARQHTGSLVAPHLGLLLSALLQGLTGRTWSGKEELLKAVASLVSKSSEALQEPAAGQPSVAAVLDVLLRECKKDSVCYRCAALQSVAQVLQDTHTDRLQEVTHIALPLLRKNVRSLKRDDEEDEEEEGHTELLIAAIELLGKAWTDDLHTQGMFQQELCSVLCDRLKMSTWKVQLAVLRSMQLFYQRLKLLEADHRDGSALSQMLSDTCSALTAPLENRSYSSLRSDALTLLELLLRRIDESDQWECLSEPVRQQLQRSLATMETDTRPDLKDRAQTLRRKIQALP